MNCTGRNCPKKNKCSRYTRQIEGVTLNAPYKIVKDVFFHCEYYEAKKQH